MVKNNSAILYLYDARLCNLMGSRRGKQTEDGL